LKSYEDSLLHYTRPIALIILDPFRSEDIALSPHEYAIVGLVVRRTPSSTVGLFDHLPSQTRGSSVGADDAFDRLAHCNTERGAKLRHPGSETPFVIEEIVYLPDFLTDLQLFTSLVDVTAPQMRL
jgi:hypothetical protein